MSDTQQILNKVQQAVGSNIVANDTVSGGLFNKISLLTTASGARYYLKEITAEPKSSDFLPMPTSAKMRWTVASENQLKAETAAQRVVGVTVPKAVSIDEDDAYLVLEEFVGVPFQDYLVGSTQEFDDAMIYGRNLLGWLSALHHGHDREAISRLDKVSTEHKAYKIDLQYLRLLDNVPASIRNRLGKFVAEYLASTETILHGDINSRNILVGRDQTIAVIDFEQGHCGEGVYDVAYIISEFAIAAAYHSRELEDVVADLVGCYSPLSANLRSRSEVMDSRYVRFRIHLAFQVLYRIVGPSRAAWTSHLSDPQKQKLAAWAVGQLNYWSHNLSYL